VVSAPQHGDRFVHGALAVEPPHRRCAALIDIGQRGALVRAAQLPVSPAATDTDLGEQLPAKRTVQLPDKIHYPFSALRRVTMQLAFKLTPQNLRERVPICLIGV